MCVKLFPFLFFFNSVNSGEKKDVVKNLKVGEKNCWIKPNQRSYPLQRREKTKELRLADDIVLPLTLYSLTLLWFIKWLQLKVMIPGLVSNLIFCLSVHPITLWTVIWINIFLSISQFWLDLSDAKICLGYQTHFVKRIFLLIFLYGKGHWLLLKTRSKTLSCGINNLLQILQYIN